MDIMQSEAPPPQAPSRHAPSHFVERVFESVLFGSRWLMAPFYLGLVFSLGVLMVKFAQEFVHFAQGFWAAKDSDVILGLLTLIDLSLAGNLLVMVVFAGYENFVSKIDLGDHPDRPDWLGKIDFGGMKLKLIASIVAISGIHLLKKFMTLDTVNMEQLPWLVGIHMTFVVSGVLLAFMDLLVSRAEPHAGDTPTK